MINTLFVLKSQNPHLRRWISATATNHRESADPPRFTGPQEGIESL